MWIYRIGPLIWVPFDFSFGLCTCVYTNTRAFATTAANKPNVENLWCILMIIQRYWAATAAGSHICDTENRSDLTNMGIAIVQIDATISSGVLFSCLHTNSIYFPLSIAHAMLMRAKIFILTSTFWVVAIFSCWFSWLRCEDENDEERKTITARYFIIHQCYRKCGEKQL